MSLLRSVNVARRDDVRRSRWILAPRVAARGQIQLGVRCATQSGEPDARRAPCRRSLSTLGKLNPAALAGFFPAAHPIAQPPRRRRPRVGTCSTHQHCLRAMSATLAKQFERFAECCLELARNAETMERRARFIQMAHEYRLATLLTSEEPSSGP
jgi:hypothetical protein